MSAEQQQMIDRTEALQDRIRNASPLVMPRIDLPNHAGYKFIGVMMDGTERLCEVIKGSDGLHTVKDGLFSQLKGWRRIKQS